MEELLKAIEHDSLPLIKKILQNGSIDLNSDVVIGAEYDLDEPDEIPLLFYLIQKGASLQRTSSTSGNAYITASIG